MRKAQVGTAIIWSIGFLFLVGFLLLGFYRGEWQWGILFFVIVFFGWGLERSIGSKEPPKPAVRLGRRVVTAIVSGLICLFIAIFVLMSLGTKHHGNYEYYGQYPALYLVPGLIGLFLPSLLTWGIHKLRSQKK